MKEIKTNFDFKFLNKVMYIGAIIGIFYFLKNLGIMDKIVDCLVSLMPVFLGLVICWISMPLTNKLKKLGLSKGMSAIISLIIIYGVLIAIFAIINMLRRSSQVVRQWSATPVSTGSNPVCAS